MQQSYALKGLNCQSCVKKIEQGIAPYAETVKVDLAASRLDLKGAKLSFFELKDRIAQLGHYELFEQIAPQQAASSLRNYYPLILIVAYLIVVSMAGAQNFSDWMRHFMGGFFLAFSFFKLLNIQKFADSYAKYDLLAMRWKPYGLIYPFCELGLGLAYIFGLSMQATLYATLALTLFSACGVIGSMRRKEKIHCACLGDLLNAPLSTVTLIEDLGMAAMAIGMLSNL